MTITEKILADHETRKGAEGISWFTDADLQRLGIQEALFTAMQNVQHALRLNRAKQVVESGGCTDRWSLRDAE